MDTTEWNAETYHRVSEPQWNWGIKVLSELELKGDEVVLDAGCGTGRLTAVLLERLPRGRVIALDASANMLEVARRELARFGERVAFVHADLQSLTLQSVCDVVFSTATFHWVLDHRLLFQGLFRALKAGGRLHAQCGGQKNLAGFLTLVSSVVTQQPEFRPYFEGFEYPAHFAPAGETVTLLEAAGFLGARAWLTEAPTPFADEQAFSTFTSSVVLRHAFERLPVALHGLLTQRIAAAAEAGSGFTLDYVRLELRGHRG